MKAVGLGLVAVAGLVGCQPSPRHESTGDTSAAASSAVQADSTARHVDDTAATSVTTVSKPPIGADTTTARPLDSTLRRADGGSLATVQAILSSDTLIGRRVRVTGRCVGYGRIVAVGGPPRTRSDWQLEDGGSAIYVTGSLPAGCDALQGSEQRTTIIVTVAEDTLPARGERPATSRRYLIRLFD